MSRIAKKILVLGALVFLPFSCAKIPEWAPPGEGKIAIEKLPAQDAVPLKWGNLVSVSTSPEVSHVMRLWFQDDQGTLRMVLFNLQTNVLETHVRVILRK